MNSELSALIETTKQLTLLVQVLEQRSAEAIQEQQKAGHVLQDTIAAVRNDVSQMVHRSGTQVAQSAQHGVTSALSQGAKTYDQAVATTTAKLEAAGSAFQQAALTVSTSAHRKILAGYAAIVGAMILLILGGSFLLWLQRQAYDDARAQTAAAQVDADTAAAYAQVGVTSCGGRPCMKLDAQSPRWGSKGEYILLESGIKTKLTNAKR